MTFKRKSIGLMLAVVLPTVALLGCTTTTTATTSTKNTEASSTSESSSAAEPETSSSSLAVKSEAVNTFNSSEGIDENGHWKGVKALDYVTLPDYMKIPVPAEKHKIADDLIQAEINKILNAQSSSKQVLDRAIVDGDTVNIDYVGSIDGVEFEGGSTQGKGADVTIGVTQYIDNFLQQLIGHKPKEKFDIKVTFPADYGKEDLNGKEATFAITINHIVETVKPELTDEFVANNFAATTAWKSVAELKENIGKNLQISAMTAFLQQYLVENAKVKEIPGAMLDYQVNSMMSYFQNQATAYGMTVEELLKISEKVSTKEELVEKHKDKNEFSAKFNLIIQAVAEDAKITITDDDIKAYFKEKMGLDDYSAYEAQLGKPYITQVSLINKAMDLLIKNADLK